MEQNVDEVARSACDADPRSTDVRRAHAIAAKVNGTAFACACAEPDCTGGTAGDAPAKNTVVYVVADQESVDAATTPPAASESAPVEAEPSKPAATDPEPAPCSVPPAFVFGAGILPTALLAGILSRARIREVRHPGADTPAEPRYAAVASHRRFRPLPGSDLPVPRLRQTRPILRYRPHRGLPGRPDPPVKPQVSVPLSPSAENVLERRERLAGPTTTRRDCRVDLTYRAHLHHVSGQQAPVPDNCANPPPRCGPASHRSPNPPRDRGAMMPKRRHTRAHNTTKAIAAERRLNDAYVAERNKPPPF